MDRNVIRMYPGALNGLINWLEQNFHEIDEFVAHFELKDGTCLSVYDTYTVRNALGMLSMAQSSVYALANEGEFISKSKE